VATDWDLVPDVEAVRTAVDQAFGELCAAAGLARIGLDAAQPAADGTRGRTVHDLPAIGMALAGVVPAA
jgi:hypothetical protein